MNNSIILIPHYNNLSKLIITLKSISHKIGIDILVVDDGSDTKNNPNYNDLVKVLDKNVSLEVINFKENKGITNALNYGLDYILKKSEHLFIARIDCGDVCVKNRFKIQEDFLLQNKDVDIVGSWVKWLDMKTGAQVFCKKPPTEHKKIKKQMSVRCSLIHPATMYRLSAVEKIGKYPSHYEAAEDYAYFFYMTKNGKAANIPKFLTSVEHNKNGISHSKRKEQSRNKVKIIYKYSSLNFNSIYGIFYNAILMTIPQHTVNRLKSKFYNN
jgi:glycosyltransferase involved in cell wall biosynthesis